MEAPEYRPVYRGSKSGAPQPAGQGGGGEKHVQDISHLPKKEQETIQRCREATAANNKNRKRKVQETGGKLGSVRKFS